MEIKKLYIKDKEQLYNLINIIENNLQNKDFWLPIKQISKDHYFDDKWTEFYGIFDNKILIAASALFYNKNDYQENLKMINYEMMNIAMIGRAMVHPCYRGKNLLYNINSKLVDIAREKGIEYLFATIHPNNIASQKSFIKLGMSKQITFKNKIGYVRDIYLMKI